jgi:hypothetical protein
MKNPSNNPNEYDRTLSLREYRLLHPQTADYPTLTESTVVGSLLERRRRRLVRAARRKELYRQVLALPRKVAVTTWQWAMAHLPKKTASQPAAPAPRPAFAKFDQPVRMGA